MCRSELGVIDCRECLALWMAARKTQGSRRSADVVSGRLLNAILESPRSLACFTSASFSHTNPAQYSFLSLAVVRTHAEALSRAVASPRAGILRTRLSESEAIVFSSHLNKGNPGEHRPSWFSN